MFPVLDCNCLLRIKHPDKIKVPSGTVVVTHLFVRNTN